ncbi:septal ring lytic transglycosylase RlpA family protein [Flavobacterium macacae]|uniref:Probable endolytic peptidoglycan transglycosylase RlpA n=1 Tax=Flavobacterium macacae TaxID=2488993 RepID=A0A3P3W807_9FLAO|nr:septal ring lytic transglycosylase RlpA family protein [Flavobacterium macacae]RRJ89739.1 septal ring lytic transglycosylase RlpA family protein [Flavobacterium macacae]
MKSKVLLLLLVLGSVLTSCSSSKSVSGKMYKKNAHASYYADKFNGRKTANGEKFSNSKLTAAHRKLPFGTKVRVTNKVNSKSVIVEINDRGPWVPGRDIDLSKKAFMDIAENKNQGALKVSIEIIK